MNTQVYDNYGARSSSSSSSSNIPEMESILNLGETENERNLRIINTRRKQVF